MGDYTHVTIRMHRDLLALVRERAAVNGRGVSAEVRAAVAADLRRDDLAADGRTVRDDSKAEA